MLNRRRLLVAGLAGLAIGSSVNGKSKTRKSVGRYLPATIGYPPGHTLYGIFRNNYGKVWVPSLSKFEIWGTESRTAKDYAMSLTYHGGSLYRIMVPPEIACPFDLQIFHQKGCEPKEEKDYVTGSMHYTSRVDQENQPPSQIISEEALRKILTDIKRIEKKVDKLAEEQ